MIAEILLLSLSKLVIFFDHGLNLGYSILSFFTTFLSLIYEYDARLLKEFTADIKGISAVSDKLFYCFNYVLGFLDLFIS